MKLKDQFTVATAAAVAVAIVLASGVIFVVVRGYLRGQVDRSLETGQFSIGVEAAPTGPTQVEPRDREGFVLRVPPPEAGEVVPYVQLVTARGDVEVGPSGHDAIEPSAAAIEVAASGGHLYEDVHYEGQHLRVLTRATEPGVAIQVARSLEEVDATLRWLAVFLVALSVGGIVVAGFLGRLVARAALAPVANLTETAEHVSATSDLSRRIHVQGDDEIGRLASTFNEMLATLEESLRAQKQLVADASHELRTPLTSVRTNLELLARDDLRDPEERRRILAATIGEIESLTALVSDVVELARGAQPTMARDEIALDEIVADVVARASLRAPEIEVQSDVRPWLVRGDRAALERAVANLVDNALKWTPSGSTVEVVLRNGELTVADSGPGIAAADLPRIFDRFYRAPNARSLPGSGLGLAIVRQVVDRHGGEIRVENASNGGAVFRVRLPEIQPREVLS